MVMAIIYYCSGLGYARRKHREPCHRVVSFLMSLRVDKIYERRIVWDKLLADRNSEPYGQLSYEAIRAVSYYLIVLLRCIYDVPIASFIRSHRPCR